LRHRSLESFDQLLAIVRGLARPGGGRVQRLTRRLEPVQGQVGLGQPQIRVVARLDVRPVGDDVASRLGAKSNGAPEPFDRAEMIPALEGRETGAVGLVPFLGHGETCGQQQAQREGRGSPSIRAVRPAFHARTPWLALLVP
jgi:hypothetical protein